MRNHSFAPHARTPQFTGWQARHKKHSKYIGAIDNLAWGRYDSFTNQRWRRVASRSTAKGAADSGTAARGWQANGLRRALRKETSRQRRDRTRYPGGAYHGYADEIASPTAGSEAEWHRGNSASARRRMRVGAFLFPVFPGVLIHDDTAPFQSWRSKAAHPQRTNILKGRHEQ